MSKQKLPPQREKNTRFARLILTAAIVVVIIIALIFLVWNPENDGSRSQADVNNAIPTLASIANGKALAQSYCSSCHMLPDPSLLNRAKWNTLLPQMGLRLGIREHRGVSYTEAVKAPDLYIPQKPILDDVQWQDIVDYYLNTAPIRLPAQNRSVAIQRKMPFFSFTPPPAAFFGGQVLGCMVRIDSTVKPARIFVANGRRNELYLFTNQLKSIDSVKTSGPVVDILFDHGKRWICTIGKELGANSDKMGSVNELDVSRGGKLKINTTPLFSNLSRPVQVLAADLNNDGQTDYVVCEFGNINGGLYWMENKGDGKFLKHLIRGFPGAIKAYVDYSANKKAPDLWVLFAQGEEGIYHFINNGSGTFEEKRVLRFPPIYGSSFFELVDINHDGFKDIIYTCGDNGDATLALKPYHGVYIFLNDKHGNYAQKYFYPVNGCYKAYARDFDGDGNIDIATISLFTSARQPEEGFVFLKNSGGLNFKAYALPPGIKFERAVTMDIGDLSGDGKPDLVIGNAFFNFGPFKANVKEPLFFILKNKTR